jgi:molybdate transport system regulatory protein
MTSLFIRIIFPSGGWLGPGKAELLDAIDRTGSISGAARAMGMSYRRAWQMVDQVKDLFTTPVIEVAAGGTRGGGARLTPFGRTIVRRYRSMEKRIARATAADREALERHARRR